MIDESGLSLGVEVVVGAGVRRKRRKIISVGVLSIFGFLVCLGILVDSSFE